MKQTPLTNMENRWVHSTKEAFDALVEMGYALYACKYLGYKKLEVASNGIIFQVGAITSTSKQAYYHNDHFYDQPYEEFTITDEKVPFPELEDIEWVMVEAPEWMLDTSFRFGGGFVFAGVHHIYMNNTKDDDDKMFVRLNKSEYSVIKALHENSKDFKVSFKLKEKINRNLHENRPLALAIGRLIDEKGAPIKVLHDGETKNLYIVSVTGNRFKVGGSTELDCTIPDDYIIPEQVLQWMKEYDHTS